MVRSSTAKLHNFICPQCNDQLARDRKGQGFVRHLHEPDCGFDSGRDEINIWREVENDDNGSLITGDVKLSKGAVIRIRGEDKTRTVTYVMGSNQNGWRVTTKGQGAMPTGHIAWQIVAFGTASEDISVIEPLPPPAPPEPQGKLFDFHTAKGVVEFVAGIMAIVAGIAAFVGWMLGMFR